MRQFGYCFKNLPLLFKECFALFSTDNRFEINVSISRLLQRYHCCACAASPSSFAPTKSRNPKLCLEIISKWEIACRDLNIVDKNNKTNVDGLIFSRVSSYKVPYNFLSEWFWNHIICYTRSFLSSSDVGPGSKLGTHIYKQSGIHAESNPGKPLLILIIGNYCFNLANICCSLMSWWKVWSVCEVPCLSLLLSRKALSI